MSRRYYKKRYRKSNTMGLSRNEREVLHFIFELIRALIYVIIEISKQIWKLSRYINRRIVNRRVLNKTGYSLDEILNLVRTISPRQFEVLICELFHQRGYKAELTPPTCDYGRDIILNDNIFIECKHFREDNYVGREICQKLMGSVHMFKAKRGIIVTTGKYHKNAYECAGRVNNLQLMDITDIQRMFLELKTEQVNKVIMKTLNASK